mgnify:CR=1 FL=1|jgi:hypothetical protein
MPEMELLAQNRPAKNYVPLRKYPGKIVLIGRGKKLKTSVIYSMVAKARAKTVIIHSCTIKPVMRLSKMGAAQTSDARK